MMKKKCLFVVEGEDTERNEVSSFAKGILSLLDQDFSVSALGTNIHVLMKDYSKNEYGSIVSYLVEKKELVLEKGIKPSKAFSLIYLVFDFDPQDPLFDKEKIKEFASSFDDETRTGKLYLNYPMFEAALDITSFEDGSFLKRSIPLKGLSSDSYKKEVKERTCLHHKKNGSLIYPMPDYFYRKIITLNDLKYRSLCHKSDDEEWKETDTLALLDVELGFLECEEPYVSVICSFVLLANDY